MNIGVLIMEKSSIADNQQERLLAWLGGIMDGEGSFSITRKRDKGKIFYYPDISIVNTDPIIIDQCAVTISSICGYHIETKHSCDFGTNNRRKTKLWRIRILGFNRCSKFLPKIIPYLVGKKKQAELVLQFVLTKGVNNLELREQTKQDLKALRNPQRLYAGQYKILKI